MAEQQWIPKRHYIWGIKALTMDYSKSFYFGNCCTTKIIKMRIDNKGIDYIGNYQYGFRKLNVIRELYQDYGYLENRLTRIKLYTLR